jgi:hypothetical protein
MKEYEDSTYGKGLISENDMYFVPNDGSRVYVKEGAAAPVASAAAARRASTTIKSKTYQGYDSANFLKDCLHTAEEIINGRQLQPGAIYSKVKATGANFGESDPKNITRANDSTLNDAAAPGSSEAYVIVNTLWGTNDKDAYPYHAAAVVAADGKDRITLEVFASNRDARDRNVKGAYKMYTTEGAVATFHGVWKAYFKNATVTTVIVKK